MKILLIGPYPPPLGGVSVYVKRYLRQLAEAGHTVKYVNWALPSRWTRYRTLLAALAGRYDWIDLHVLTSGIARILSLSGLAGKTAITIHSSTDLDQWTPKQARRFDVFLRRCRRLILVGPHLENRLRDNGVFIPSDCVVRPAFIPPPPDEEKAILRTYPKELLQFSDRHRPLLVANACRLTIVDGVDLYGLDLCVELMDRLRTLWPEVGLIFALPAVGDADYFRKIQDRIKDLDVGGHIAFLTDQRELWPLFKRADVMVRPTSADGYGISIAEALHCGCPAVASDVCRRPEGTILFKNRDLDDLVRQCNNALAVRYPRPEASSRLRHL